MSNKDNKDSNKDSRQLALSFAWELGYSIVIPLLFFAIGGRLLDEKFSCSPFIFLLAIVLSILVSTFVIYKKVTRIISIVNKKENDKK
ncbi:MAG: AtpZ/AtpI family protein [Patescibacteria group bacterium]|nr:AtpZ/AtpI family protein [Patescibacteria group bacterium]